MFNRTKILISVLLFDILKIEGLILVLTKVKLTFPVSFFLTVPNTYTEKNSILSTTGDYW